MNNFLLRVFAKERQIDWSFVIHAGFQTFILGIQFLVPSIANLSLDSERDVACFLSVLQLTAGLIAYRHGRHSS